MTSHHRSSGHSTVRMSKRRTHDMIQWMYWYFQENGVLLPDDMICAFRTGFNMGWKAKKRDTKLDKRKEE